MASSSVLSLVSESWQLVAAAVVAILVVSALYQTLATPLAKIPGPLLSRFSRIWLFGKIYNGTYHHEAVKLHKRYGPIVRIAPNEYSVDDPASVQLIYGSKGGFTKGPWYRTATRPNSNVVNLFAERDPAVHAVELRRISSAYSMTSLVTLEPFINDTTKVLRARLDEFVASGEQIDVTQWMQFYAFEVIGAITFGSRFGFLDKGEDIGGIIDKLEQSLTHATRMGVFPEWHEADFKLNSLLDRHAMPQVVGFMMKYISPQMEKPLAPPAPASSSSSSSGGGPTHRGPEAVDFVTRFRRMAQETPGRLTDSTIRSSCFANIGAGSDTTSISFTAVLFQLSRHREALVRLRAEVDDAYKTGALTDPVTFKQAQTLPYLQAVIKEALRCFPATGLSLQRMVPAGGATIAGQYFPPGTLVGINAWVAHANKDVWGDDADVFRPERWLEAPEIVKRRESYYMTFGAGSRTCIGKNISILEMNKVIPTLVRYYEFEPENPEADLQTMNCWFIKPYNFRCRIKARVPRNE